jgi:dephospho-CoA kinase
MGIGRHLHRIRPERITLTGGIATGKSTVAKMFADLGAHILDADQVAREVVQPGTQCWQKLRDFLGSAYFEQNGQLRRWKLRQKIMHDSNCRLALNTVMHPYIVQEMERKWESLQMTQRGLITIFDIPLLFEAHLANCFDTIILVYTPREIQIQRLMLRDGLSQTEAAETLSMQLPIEVKRARSHLTIDNSADLDHTLRQVKTAWERLISQRSLNTST